MGNANETRRTVLERATDAIALANTCLDTAKRQGEAIVALDGRVLTAERRRVLEQHELSERVEAIEARLRSLELQQRQAVIARRSGQSWLSRLWFGSDAA